MSCSSNSALSIALLLLSALFICHGAVGVQGSVADFLKEKTGGDQVEILTDASLMESCGYPRECVCDETSRSKGKKMTPCTPLEIQTKCEVCVTDLVIDGRYNKGICVLLLHC